jgi:hypothetical protein
MLKQDSREHEQTCKSLTTVRAQGMVFLVDLGKIPNWGNLLDDSSHGVATLVAQLSSGADGGSNL